MEATTSSDYMDALDGISFGSGFSLRSDAIRQRRWRALNPERARIRWVVSNHNRRAARRGLTDRVELSEWIALIEGFNFRCACCGQTGKLTMDHIRPLARGGRHRIVNLQPLCWPCHKAKGMQEIRYSGGDVD